MVVIAIPVLTFSSSAIEWLESRGLVSGWLEMAGLLAAKWGVSTLLVLVMIGLLYSAGDPSRRGFRLITPGAILALVLILVLSQVLAFIFGNITDYNALYGSIGAILAVQLWIYLNMLALLIGHELNISISRARQAHRRELRPVGRA